MHRIAFQGRRRAAAAVGGLLAVATVAVTTGQSAMPAAAFDGPEIGIVCSNGPTFNLVTDSDYINLADGNTAYMYGYKLVGTQFQHPSPVLCVKQGETVTITLTNTLPRDVSIVVPRPARRARRRGTGVAAVLDAG